MMYTTAGITACMAIFSAVQFVNAHRQNKGGLRIVWGLLLVAFVLCFVGSAYYALSASPGPA